MPKPETFQAGDRVQLTGPKGRLNTLVLATGAKYGTHKGELLHDDIIGKPEGSVILNSAAIEYLALKPLLSDFVLAMPRGANIIYPKDAGQIIAMGDIHPGARVVEAGLGSGGLATYLLRAVGEGGTLTSFERREEFANIAKANVATEMGIVAPNWNVIIGDLQQKLVATCGRGETDRVVLDMLAPWECIDEVATALRPGGVLIVYVATVTQLSRVVEEIRHHGGFTDSVSQEIIQRGWHVDGLAVRPEHRMIGHTGYLMFARRLAPNTELPVFKAKRASKTEYSDDDMAIWNPDSLGEQSVSSRKIRKNIRKAETAQAAKAAQDKPLE